MASILEPAPRSDIDLSERSLENRLREIWETRHTVYGFFATADHKTIGIRYLVTAFSFLLGGGIEALLMRLQLLRPEGRALGRPEAYDQVFTLHGVTMLLWYAAPVLAGFGNYLVPLLLAAGDTALPRLNAIGYWTFLLSGVFLYASVPFGLAPFYAVALVLLTLSTTLGAINLVVTILRRRPPGMSVERMPLLLYSTGSASVVAVLAFPALIAACVLLDLDRRGGDPILWADLLSSFWHPWIYIVFLSATGMTSMLVAVFARRAIVGATVVAWSTVLTAVAGVGVWVHHMLAVGASHVAPGPLGAASTTISVFGAIQVVAWLTTLWRGRPVLTASLLFALGFIATFVIGALSGVAAAGGAFDPQAHDASFVVARLDSVLTGASLFPVLAALYYWFPKMSGRMLGERLGRLSFWVTFVGFNVAFFPAHLTGFLAMRRRVPTYGTDEGLASLDMLGAVGAVAMGVGLLLTLWNVARSRRLGLVAGANPWQADTLEWATSSPPPRHRATPVPIVRSRHPLWDDERADPRNQRVVAERWRGLATSRLALRPVAVARMPPESPR
jgi:cytochrome c oxidase subunit 1/cytochrome c oxidase subunit I+III